MEGALQSNTFHKVYPFSHFAFPTWYPADKKPRTEEKKKVNGGVGLSGITCLYSRNRTESREEQCSTLFELIELCPIIIIQLLLLNYVPFFSTISGVLVSGCPKLLKGWEFGIFEYNDGHTQDFERDIVKSVFLRRENYFPSTNLPHAFPVSGYEMLVLAPYNGDSLTHLSMQGCHSNIVGDDG